MSRADHARLLPHERAFGLLLAGLWLGLVFAGGLWSRDALISLGLLVGAGAVAGWCGSEGTTARWRVRLAYYPLLMNATYFLLKTVVPALHPGGWDTTLQALDRVLLGGASASGWTDSLRHPLLTEFLSFCYLIFFPYLFFSWVYYFARKDLGPAKKFWSGFFTLYAVGFLGYLIVPAAGPHLDPALAASFAGFHGPITELNARIVAAGSNRVDCFPSLHVAVSAYLLWFDWRNCRWRFWLWLVPCLGLWVSTLYLGYHYFVDLLAGLALTGATMWAVDRFFAEKKL